VTKANEFHKSYVVDLQKRIVELEKQLNNQITNQFNNLTAIADESATSSASAKRNSLGSRNLLTTSATIMNDDLVVHAQDDDNNITGADDGPSSGNNRSDLQQSDDSVSSNESPGSTSQRNSLEDFIAARNDNDDGNKMKSSGGIQMQDMSPKTNETNTKLGNSSTVVSKNTLHSFGSVGNSFARKVDLNQFLIGDDYQAPPKYNNASNNSWYNSVHKN